MVRDKHHAWVELYFDLVFVFAVGQLTHLIVATAAWRTVLLAFGLFVMLWWTWIGFVVHYNRHGEDRAAERLILIAGTVPCAIAAIQAHGAADGHLAGFALALAGTRLVLAAAYFWIAPGERRGGPLYLLTAALLVVSALLPAFWQFATWAAVVVLEATALLLSGLRRGDRPRAVNARHLAERFNLFMIIMLGEVVISVGVAAADQLEHGAGYWIGLNSGLILAGALWWVYFDQAADINANLLRTSGGNPATAYALYAAGYLMPAFAVLLLAAGCALTIQEFPPNDAAWYVTLGLGGYLAGVRGFGRRPRRRRRYLLLALLVAVTIGIALLDVVLKGEIVIAIAAAWALAVAAAMARRKTRLSY